jgi:hypothetical protein
VGYAALNASVFGLSLGAKPRDLRFVGTQIKPTGYR